MAFPKIGVAGFAWIAPGLILATALGKRPAEAWRIGYFAGVAHYLFSLGWLLNIPVTGFPILGWIALALFVALFPATWVWLSLKVSGVRYPASGVTWVEGLRGIMQLNWSERMSWALRSAAIWVALEMLLARIFGGFPEPAWRIAVSHHAADSIRVVHRNLWCGFSPWYGLRCHSLCAAASILGRPTQPLAVDGGNYFAIHGGRRRIFPRLSSTRRQPAATIRELRVALIQPGIPQTLIWNPTKDTWSGSRICCISRKTR